MTAKFAKGAIPKRREKAESRRQKAESRNRKLESGSLVL
jgi:hypothetical protein